MKSFVIAVVLCSSLAFVNSVPAAAPTYEQKENNAIQECNVTNPVQRNPRIRVGQSVVSGEPITVTPEERCFLFCFFQKVGVLDENATLKNPQKLINYTLNNEPELAKYSDVLIANLFQIKRTSKAFDHDKCLKAFVFYQELATDLFALAVADGLQSTTGIKDKIVDSLHTGKNVDEAIVKEVQEFLTFLDAFSLLFAE